MPFPKTVDVPDGYDPKDPLQRALLSRYDNGERTDEVRQAKSIYNAWYRRSRANAPAPAPAPAKAVSPTLAAAPKPSPATPRLVQVSSLGSSRRLQALTWLGYDLDSLEREIRLEQPAIVRLLWARPVEIPASVAHTITTHYRRLLIRPQDPTIPAVALARDLARLVGWAGPGRWDDIDQDTEPRPAHDDQRPTIVTDGDEAAVVAREDPSLQEDLAAAQQAARDAISEKRIAEQARDSAEANARGLSARCAELEQAAADNVTLTDRLAAAEQTAEARAVEQTQLREDHAQLERLRDVLLDNIRQLEARLELATINPDPVAEAQRVIVEQIAGGGSRITFSSTRPAQIRFAGLEVNVIDAGTAAS